MSATIAFFCLLGLDGRHSLSPPHTNAWSRNLRLHRHSSAVHVQDNVDSMARVLGRGILWILIQLPYANTSSRIPRHYLHGEGFLCVPSRTASMLFALLFTGYKPAKLALAIRHFQQVQGDARVLSRVFSNIYIRSLFCLVSLE